MLSGDELVKSEQSTLHLPFLYSNFMVLSGEQMVKGEQSIVHLKGQSDIKRPAVAGLR